MQLIAIKPMGALGRIVIPSEVRKSWGLQPGTAVGIYIDKGRVILQALDDEERCFLCGKPSQRQVRGKYLCEECINEIAKERRKPTYAKPENSPCLPSRSRRS